MVLGYKERRVERKHNAGEHKSRKPARHTQREWSGTLIVGWMDCMWDPLTTVLGGAHEELFAVLRWYALMHY